MDAVATPQTELTPKGQATIAAESVHWYAKDGSPVYEVAKAKGGMRPATLADARKLGLVPSVTTILNCAAKPGLENWKLRQMLEAALTLPRKDGETLDDFADRVVEDSKAQGKAAAERGTSLHTAIEKAIRGEDFDIQWREHVEKTIAAFAQLGIDLFSSDSESSFSCQMGYGGKSDAHCKKTYWLADWKTKDRIDDKKPLAFDNHAMQLGAYSLGIFARYTGIRAFNAFVGVEDKQVRIIEWTANDLERGWMQFSHLLEYWYLTTGLERNGQ